MLAACLFACMKMCLQSRIMPQAMCCNLNCNKITLACHTVF